jgi:uncharacterized Zn finger protein (UPF0148 family)
MDNEVECKKCGYKWKSKSGMLFVNCPKCLRKTKIIKIKKKETKKVVEEEDYPKSRFL